MIASACARRGGLLAFACHHCVQAEVFADGTLEAQLPLNWYIFPFLVDSQVRRKRDGTQHYAMQAGWNVVC